MNNRGIVIPVRSWNTSFEVVDVGLLGGTPCGYVGSYQRFGQTYNTEDEGSVPAER
jgi:hypothetical protein